MLTTITALLAVSFLTLLHHHRRSTARQARAFDALYLALRIINTRPPPLPRARRPERLPEAEVPRASAPARTTTRRPRRR